MMDNQGQFEQISIIDLGPLSDSSTAGLAKVAQAIDYAYSQVGFAYLINHGVDQALIDELFAASEESDRSTTDNCYSVH